MQRVITLRGLSDWSLSDPPSVPAPVSSSPPLDLLGPLASGVQSVENTLYNGLTGNLTSSQAAAIAAQRNADIAKAGAGNQDLISYEQALGNKEQSAVVAAGYNSGVSNVLGDLGLDPNAPAGVGSTGLLGWIENNPLLVFGLVAAFVVFRPDKAFKRR